jgi:hypothetical protein
MSFTTIQNFSSAVNSLIGLSSFNMIKRYSPTPIVQREGTVISWLRDQFSSADISLCYLVARCFNKHADNIQLHME